MMTHTPISASRRTSLRCLILLALATACSDGMSGPGEAGPAVATQAEVSASQTTVTSGATATLSLRAIDAQGRALTRGGSAVVFNTSGGSSTGVVSATTDRGNGTYEATFTGVIAGTATTIGATFDGTPVTTPLPAIRVQPGVFSPGTSSVTVTPRTIQPGGTATLELIARDAAGNRLETGGLSVSLEVSGGSAVGVVGDVTDHGNGRYTAPFTAAQVGSPLNVSAEVNGAPVSSPSPTVAVARGISLEQSVLSIAHDTVSVNGGLRVTLEVRDSSGVARTSGGDTVQFSITREADGGEGTLDDFTDHDDGTYTARLLATRPGAVTLGVRINGRNKEGPLPTVMIQSSPVTAQKSTVMVSADTVAAGDTATLKAELRDLDGALLTAGDLKVRFTATVNGESVDGASTGKIGATRYDGQGIYSAIFTAARAGTPVTVGATIGDSTQIQMLDSLGTSHLPRITVIPGLASADSTLVDAAPSRVPLGDSATIRLRARDGYGNPLAAGGLAVAFQREGGKGVSVGRIGPVSDHQDGTYTAQYVGDSAGLPDVIHATLEGFAVTSPSPTLTVGPACTAGPVSLAISDLTINDTTRARFPVKALTLPSGVTTTVTLRVNDSRSCPVSQSHAVVVTATGGTSTGVVGDVVNLGDGRYEMTFIGQVAGTTTTLTATIDGATVTSPAVTVKVTPGDVSTQKSVFRASRATIVAGDSVELSLEARDAAGNRITSGGRTVLFVITGDNPGGVVGSTRDGGDGTYAARYIGTRPGATDIIAARIDGTPILQKVTVGVSP